MSLLFDGGNKICARRQKLIESNKVATHDLMPGMKAKEITDEIISAIQRRTSFIVANLLIWIWLGIAEK